MRLDLPLFVYLAGLRIRTRLQSRLSLVLAWLSQGFGYAGSFAAIWLILHHFGTLAGWTPLEILFLVGFHTLGYALGACFTFVQLRGMETMVRDGTFDTLLTRPISPLLFQCLSGVNIDYGSHVLLGAGLMAWTAPQLDPSWSLGSLLMLGASLASAALLAGGMMVIIGASALVLGRSRYLFGLFFDFWELARFPGAIYAAPLQLLMLTLLPFAYMAYVPVAVLLGKPVAFLGPLAAFAALSAGPIMAVIAALVWRFALRRYQRG